MKKYKQCKLSLGNEFQEAWIETRGAKVGALVEIKGVEEVALWKVEKVFDYEISEDILRENQRLNRNSFSSID